MNGVVDAMLRILVESIQVLEGSISEGHIMERPNDSSGRVDAL